MIGRKSCQRANLQSQLHPLLHDRSGSQVNEREPWYDQGCAELAESVRPSLSLHLAEPDRITKSGVKPISVLLALMASPLVTRGMQMCVREAVTAGHVNPAVQVPSTLSKASQTSCVTYER